MPRSRTGSRWPRPARPSSTSAASRPGPGADAGRRRRRAAPRPRRRARARRADAGAGEHRHDEGGRRPGRARRGRGHGQRRVRRNRRSRHARRSSPSAGAAYVAMHIARHPAHDAARSRTTPTSSREVGDELRARVDARARRRRRRRARCSPIPVSASPRRPSTTSRCCARCPSSRRASVMPLLVGTSRKSFLAPHRRCRRRRRRAAATTRRSPPRCGASNRVPRSCACTTSPDRGARSSCSRRSDRATPEGMAA